MKVIWTVRPWERWTLGVICLIMLVGISISVRCWQEAHRLPVVTRYVVPVRGLPVGTKVSIAFLSDTHVNEEASASSINLSRLDSVMDRMNAIKPDIMLLGGDYIATTGRAGDVPLARAVSSFSRLRARYGVFSVVGNHDCQETENTPERIRRDLTASGARPLVNEYVAAGPVTIAGLDDLWCGSSDIATASRAVEASAGRPVILVSHNPDVFPDVPGSVALTVAGHTHGAQIVPPLYGPIVSVSRYGQRYRYGHIVEKGRHLVVSSGLGGLPLRWNAPPEIVLIELRSMNKPDGLS